MYRKSSFFLAAMAILLLGVVSAQAQTTWTINPAASFAHVLFNDTVIPATVSPTASTLTLHLGNQQSPALSASGPWTVGATGALSGTLQTNYVDGTSIQFNGGTMAGVDASTNNPFIVAPTGGNYVPDPAQYNAGGPGTKFGGPSSPNIVSAVPAMWGGSLSVNELAGGNPQGFFDFLNTAFQISSGVLPITTGTFAASATNVGLTQYDSGFVSGSALASDSLVTAVNPAANPHNHGLGIDGLPAPSWAGNNGVSTATITTVGNLRTLTYTYSLIPNPGIGYFPVVFYSGSVPFIGAMTGQIVATTVTPEPSSVILGSLGLVAALGLCIRRKLKK